MSKNSVSSVSSRRSTTSSPAASASARARCGSQRRGPRGLRTEEVLDEFEDAGRADLLREVRATGLQHARDLRPPGGHRMPADHQVERRVPERQRRLVRVGDHDRAARVQEGGGAGDVRRPGLGGDGHRRQLRGGGEDLAAAGLDVEGRLRPAQPVGHGARIPPGGALLGGPAVEPGEVPAVDGDGGGLGDERFEACAFLFFGCSRHAGMVSSAHSRARPNSGAPAGQSGGRDPRAIRIGTLMSWPRMVAVVALA